MALYGKDGNELSQVFNPSGLEIGSAFNKDGGQVYSNVRTLKVMTYNVGEWYDGKHDNVPADKDADYYALQKGMILANNPDVLCMEEYTKQFSKAGRTANSLLLECGFSYIIETKGDSPTASPANGRCIASKFPIADYTVRNFGDGSQLYYDTCVITVRGIQIHFVITHLHWDDRSKRTSEMETIVGLLRGFDRFVLCGDFNTTDCYDTSGADYTAVIQQLVSEGYHLANCGDFGFKITYSSYSDNNWTAVLDNIVTSSNITILNVAVDETKLNDNLTERIDHMPLVATLQI